ncbi:hypothetical protein BD289DRAFT_256955 [Coniella lustricola]|uniref:Uncharacterized protein n=1 Tax=Coniella lustricola TaxID=2025994 RepID=A0A2T3AKW4_9PEZI|nr:hypothetical protein BD289DRAFT_256955 [Coniella lustricola]
MVGYRPGTWWLCRRGVGHQRTVSRSHGSGHNNSSLQHRIQLFGHEGISARCDTASVLAVIQQYLSAHQSSQIIQLQECRILRCIDDWCKSQYCVHRADRISSMQPNTIRSDEKQSTAGGRHDSVAACAFDRLHPRANVLALIHRPPFKTQRRRGALTQHWAHGVCRSVSLYCFNVPACRPALLWPYI